MSFEDYLREEIKKEFEKYEKERIEELLDKLFDTEQGE